MDKVRKLNTSHFDNDSVLYAVDIKDFPIDASEYKQLGVVDEYYVNPTIFEKTRLIDGEIRCLIQEAFPRGNGRNDIYVIYTK